jgi:rubrerythrin
MRFDSYMIKGAEGITDNGSDSINRDVRPSSKDVQLVRKSIMEKMQAVNDYIERAEKCENDVVRKMFLDIAEEERVHFTEFEMLLEAVDPLRESSEDDDILNSEEYED